MEKPEAVEYLKEKTRAYEKRLSEIRANISRFETEANYIQGLLKSANALLREELGRGGMKGLDEFSERLNLMSLSEAIDVIVNASDVPIHADQILKTLREAGKTFEAKNPKNSIVTLLHRGVNAGRFIKVGPNLFAPVQQKLIPKKQDWET